MSTMSTPSDPYAGIADLYELAYGDYLDDVDFYTNLARAADGPVLELGVGTGRAAIPLALAGYEVVGIDTSTPMLAIARDEYARRRKAKGSLELIEADMTRFDLRRRFGLIFCAANTFQHLLTTADQLACLGYAVEHLAPGGIFALSVRSPATVGWEEGEGWAPLLLHWTKRDPASGDLVMKFCAEQPEPARMVRRLTYVYDRIRDGNVRRSVFTAELRYSTEAELRLLLQQVGLRVTHVYGDYDLSPVGYGDNIVVVARAEGGTS
jgi:SAM-dependent methyltransferase